MDKDYILIKTEIVSISFFTNILSSISTALSAVK